MQDASDGWTPNGEQVTAWLTQMPTVANEYLPSDPWKAGKIGCAQEQPHDKIQETPENWPQDKGWMQHRQSSCSSSPPEEDITERVFVALEICETGNVRTLLHVGGLPDPHASDPSTPPMALMAIKLDAMYELLAEQVSDPAKGWGVLMQDVRNVLSPAKFSENAGRCTLPAGTITWPVFVRTVLYILHR